MSRPKITANQIAATGSVAGQVPTSDGTNVSWATPSGGGGMQAITTGAGQSATLSFVTNGDANGVFYFLGSNYLGDAWTNPSTNGSVTAVRYPTATQTGTVSDVFDRSPNTTWTSSGTRDCYIFVDLGAGRSLVPNRYSLRNYSQPNREIRNWKLQGTNAVAGTSHSEIIGAVWTDLDVRVNDTSQSGADAWATFIPNQTNTTAFRYYRLLQTGNDALGGEYFCVAEWEMYGAFTYAADPVVDGRIVQTNTTAGNKVRQTRWSAASGTLSCTLAPTITTTETNGNVTLTPNGTGAVVLSTRARFPSGTPATATATGTTGQIMWDGLYLYVCIATNSWRRIAHSAW